MANFSLQSLSIVVDPERDHVAVARVNIAEGTRITNLDGQALVVQSEIPPGHRFAIRAVAAGEWVLQYGQPFAVSRGLQPGDPVNNETVDNVVPQEDPELIEIHPPMLPAWLSRCPRSTAFGAVMAGWVCAIGC